MIGNPLIDVLPCKLEAAKVFENLCHYPIYNQMDRKMSKESKVLRIRQLYNFYQPFDIHLNLYNDIDLMIREAYMGRNPLNIKAFNEKTYENYKGIHNNKVGDIDIRARNMGIGKALIGTAGVGKTSAMNRVLELFPQIMKHLEYKGQAFRYVQIVYLNIIAPHDGSLKTLLLDILKEVDYLVETTYAENAIRGRLTINGLISQVQQVLNIYHIGLLVIDEFQFLSKKSEQVLNFLTTIINTWGVSLYVVGTPIALEILQKDLRVARRFQLILYKNMERESKEWDYLLNDLWQYQYTSQITELTKEIIDYFYHYSQGITDILIKLYIEVQLAAVEQDKKITVNLIRVVSKEKMGMIGSILTAMQSGDKYLQAQYGDIL